MIYAITFVDISYSWGPAIHFVELWNEFVILSADSVVCYAVLQENDSPYTDTLFELRALRLAKNKSKLARWFFKLVFDVSLCSKFLFLRKSTVYLRQSRFGIFLLLALLLRDHRVFVEMNGLAAEDQMKHSRGNPLKVLFYNLMERLYIRLPGATIVAVAEKITDTIKKRYHVDRAYTVYNGCSSRLLDSKARSNLLDKPILNIGFLGTFTPWDGHEKTGEFYRAIKGIRDGVRFHIAGPNVRKTEVYREFKGNRDFIFYDTIPYTELKNFYQRLDAAYSFDEIARSKNVEQSTLKIIEYWASKLPILATRAKGNEYIETYQIGSLIAEEDFNHEERFAEAVGEFVSSLDTYARNFETAPLPRTWKDAASETYEIIKSVAN